MKLVVDYTAFEGRGEPVIKELALVSLDGVRAAHVLLKAPYPWTALDAETQLAYTNQIREKHGLCWDEGVLPYLELGDQLKRLTSRSIALYAHGLEKCRVLSKLAGRTFINIEDEFGALDSDCTATVGVSCLEPCHGLSRMNCAFRNADRMRQWLQYYDHRTRMVNFCVQKERAVGHVAASVEQGENCKCNKKV